MDNKQETTQVDKQTLLDTARKCVERLQNEMDAIKFVQEREEDELRDVMLLSRCVSTICIVDPTRSHLFVEPIYNMMQKNVAPKRVRQVYQAMLRHDKMVAKKKAEDPECSYEYSQRNHADAMLYTYHDLVNGKVEMKDVADELNVIIEVVRRERDVIAAGVAERLTNARNYVVALTPKGN